jgi:hypothetical protein
VVIGRNREPVAVKTMLGYTIYGEVHKQLQEISSKTVSPATIESSPGKSENLKSFNPGKSDKRKALTLGKSEIHVDKSKFVASKCGHNNRKSRIVKNQNSNIRPYTNNSNKNTIMSWRSALNSKELRRKEVRWKSNFNRCIGRSYLAPASYVTEGAT